MPRKVKLEDGTELDVATEEELAQIKKDKEELEALKSDPGQKNWKEVRQKLEDAENRARLAEDELKTYKTTPPPQAPAGLTPEQIREEAQKAGREVIIGQLKDDFLKQYSEEDRKAISVYFDKLSAGENLTSESVEKHMREAHHIVFPNQGTKSFPSGSGLPPRFNDVTSGQKKESFPDTEEGKSIANEIFGSASFANEKKS